MYQPTPEQAEADRRAAYERGVPHGYVPPGQRHQGGPTITLRVVSELVRGSADHLAKGGSCSAQQGSRVGVLVSCHRRPFDRMSAHCLRLLQPATHEPREQHSEEEYGAEVGPDGRHRGGPFTIDVSPRMRVEELRNVIRVGGRWAVGDGWVG